MQVLKNLTSSWFLHILHPVFHPPTSCGSRETASNGSLSVKNVTVLKKVEMFNCHIICSVWATVQSAQGLLMMPWVSRSVNGYPPASAVSAFWGQQVRITEGWATWHVALNWSTQWREGSKVQSQEARVSIPALPWLDCGLREGSLFLWNFLFYCLNEQNYINL